MNEEMLDRFRRAHVLADETSRKLHEALDNLISSSDLNERKYEVRGVGSVEELRTARNVAWEEYLSAEAELIEALNAGLFPGEHSTG